MAKETRNLVSYLEGARHGGHLPHQKYGWYRMSVIVTCTGATHEAVRKAMLESGLLAVNGFDTSGANTAILTPRQGVDEVTVGARLMVEIDKLIASGEIPTP